MKAPYDDDLLPLAKYDTLQLGDIFIDNGYRFMKWSSQYAFLSPIGADRFEWEGDIGRIGWDALLKLHRESPQQVIALTGSNKPTVRVISTVTGAVLTFRWVSVKQEDGGIRRVDVLRSIDHQRILSIEAIRRETYGVYSELRDDYDRRGFKEIPR